MRKLIPGVKLLLVVLILGGCAQPQKAEIEIDREFRLMAYMTGYVGIGGDIDGIRNPVLRVLDGENVQVTMINGENMTHDVVIEGTDDRSPTITEKGDSAIVVFETSGNDVYYCSVPGHRATMEGQIMVIDPMLAIDGPKGMIPMKDSVRMNFDFEYNTLHNWTYTGTAFENQPSSDMDQDIYEPEVLMDLGISGEYFLTSGGTRNYDDTGTIFSDPFEVTHPYASFKVAGGALKETRVELIESATGEVIFEITGNNSAEFRPVVVDLNDYMGQEIRIRLIDQETGESSLSYIPDNVWAHISFDDFRFYESKPFFIDELHPDDIIVLPPLDILAHAGLSGDEAAAAMDLPEDFTIQLAAAEPDVVRPIAFTMDYRGRLWVVEAHTYPQKAPDGEGGDRILIFEDTDGDGTLDSRIIFYDGLNLVSGIEIGHGGVWVGAAPELLFIPIDESGSAPAGDPVVMLDGWGHQDTHETLNSFVWGPDGWLYGVQGVFTHSRVGQPGTPDEDRVPINAGVWRFHPQTHQFEVFGWGTSNPWGIDFNQYGHAFIATCVIPHLYHVIQGGRYIRQAGNHFSPYIYDDIKTIADHVHWVGDAGPHAGNSRSAAVGGGHAHAGGTIYQGAEHWSEEMRNSMLMNNIHGAKTNVDILVRDGSGYTAMHGSDFVVTNDSWSQWLDFEYGPGGSMYAIDWYDKNQCHSPNPDVHDKTLGRIFKISHKEDQFVQIDLSQATDEELVEYQLHPNEWYVRHARVLLQERGGSPEIHAALRKILDENPDVTRKLRALWALHVTDGISREQLVELWDHEDEYIRSWAIQLATESKSALSDMARGKLESMANNDPSALVRLYISSAAQRMDADTRWDIVTGLISHYGDINDLNLPLMNWYAFEPLIDLDLDRAVNMALASEQPVILQFTIRKIGGMENVNAEDVLRSMEQRLEDKFSTEINQKIREEIALTMEMDHPTG